MFAELRNLAEEQPPKNLKEASFKIGHRMDLHRFIVPVQARNTGVKVGAVPVWAEAFCGRGSGKRGSQKDGKKHRHIHARTATEGMGERSQAGRARSRGQGDARSNAGSKQTERVKYWCSATVALPWSMFCRRHGDVPP